jgi:hypothetical protein
MTVAPTLPLPPSYRQSPSRGFALASPPIAADSAMRTTVAACADVVSAKADCVPL